MEEILGRDIDLPLDEEVIEVMKDLTDTTDLAVFIPEVWAREIERQAQPKRVMRGLQPYVVLNTDLLEKPGDIVHIAKLNDLTAADELTENVCMTPEAMTGTEITLEPTEYGKAVQISRKAQRRAYINSMNEAAELLGRSLAQKEDQRIIEEAVLGATNFVYPDATYVGVDDILVTDVMTAQIFRRAGTVLKNANAPGPYVFVIHTAVEGALMDDEHFIDASRYGDREVILNGEIGTWLGMKVISTTNIESAVNIGGVTYYKNLLLAERSLVIALKANPDFAEKYEPLCRTTDIASVMEFETSALNPDRYAVVYSA